MWHVWGRRQMHVGLWWRNLKVRYHLKELDIDGLITFKWI
jgi:hypothetical protein